MLSRDCYGFFFENAKFAEVALKFMRIFFRAQGRETQLMIIMVFKSLKFFFHFKANLFHRNIKNGLKPIPIDNLYWFWIELTLIFIITLNVLLKTLSLLRFSLKFMRIFFRAQGLETQLMIIMVYKFLKFSFTLSFG